MNTWPELLIGKSYSHWTKIDLWGTRLLFSLLGMTLFLLLCMAVLLINPSVMWGSVGLVVFFSALYFLILAALFVRVLPVTLLSAEQQATPVLSRYQTTSSVSPAVPPLSEQTPAAAPPVSSEGPLSTPNQKRKQRMLGALEAGLGFILLLVALGSAPDQILWNMRFFWGISSLILIGLGCSSWFGLNIENAGLPLGLLAGILLTVPFFGLINHLLRLNKSLFPFALVFLGMAILLGIGVSIGIAHSLIHKREKKAVS